MNNKVTHLFTFMAGAIIASAVTWKITKDKYERIAQEEINSYKEHVRGKKDGVKVIVTKAEPEVFDYVKKVSDCGYDVSLTSENLEKGEPSTMNAPYTISYEEFGEADKVLVEDITDEVVEDIDCIIGNDSLLRFGEYEEDMLYVRNDNLRVDYEISLSDRSYYSDINPASE